MFGFFPLFSKWLKSMDFWCYSSGGVASELANSVAGTGDDWLLASTVSVRDSLDFQLAVYPVNIAAKEK
jgi:hypothetical protein